MTALALVIIIQITVMTKRILRAIELASKRKATCAAPTMPVVSGNSATVRPSPRAPHDAAHVAFVDQRFELVQL